MRRPRDEVTSNSYLSHLVHSANHIILMGGGFYLLALKVTALVNLSLSLINCYMIVVNSVNMFL